MTVDPSDWAKVPAALRVLPQNASVCGSVEATVFIASPLFGREELAVWM